MGTKSGDFAQHPRIVQDFVLEKTSGSGDDDDPDPKKKSKNNVKKDTVKPSFAKILEVEGNTLGAIELARDSPMAQFVRNGAPKVASVSKLLKVAGNTLGATGVLFEGAEVINGNMSYTEFGVDTIFALAPMVCPALAPVSLGYFAGKAIYEYSSGNTLFTKPR